MEVIAAIGLVALVVAAILAREYLRAEDRSAIYCPRSKNVVEICDGVCREPNSLRVVGVAMACQRECLIRLEANA